jgi:hypothetical protein
MGQHSMIWVAEKDDRGGHALVPSIDLLHTQPPGIVLADIDVVIHHAIVVKDRTNRADLGAVTVTLKGNLRLHQTPSFSHQTRF